MKTMERRRKRIITGLAVFLLLMYACTLISKSVYVSTLAIVTADTPQQKFIEHVVETEGIVVEGGKRQITFLAGLRVAGLSVRKGDRVEAGDILFRVDMEDLKEIIEKKQNESARLQVQIDTLLANQALKEQERALAEERAREDYDSISRKENTLVGRAEDEYARAKGRVQDDPDEWEQDALEEAAQRAAYGEADAKGERDEAIKQAQRKIEDILMPEAADASLPLYQLEQQTLSRELDKYRRIQKQEGYVKAETGGLITDIFIRVGERTPDTAVILMLDESVPCRFKTVLDKEQKKYVTLGGQAELRLEGSGKMDVVVEYLAESADAPGSFEVYIDLPEGTGVPGLSGTMICKETGERHSRSVPSAAVHNSFTRNYVYVVKEREGILGAEYYIEEITVKIADQNEEWTAVEGGLDADSKVVISATKEIHNGDTVRYIP